MKKTIYSLVFTLLIAGTGLTGCKSSTKEEIEAELKVEEAKDNLVEVKKEASAEEWKTFEKDTDSVININKIRIAELKLNLKKTGKSIDANYNEKIEVLEQKNKDLKSKMDTYKNDASNDWKSFKNEFNHDMNELGNALKDFTVDNKK
ncbi:peptidase M23 [Flavobacterium sp. K5-23]|uniref:peptidase M23 n=1 Tax=Flavobacterium sp. K5-23 TaxID=2746225 RepID=UPI00200DD245|nr:peptidase M23 [Flavobacterium sp. K5-23]UQD56676.1 peptidase M23 [Flavobacterium sp. K5-23]